MTSTEQPHILLLDEPTNHLDVDAREALVHALNTYDGAVVLVSHDAHLVELVCDRLWLVADGGCHAFEGDLTDYRDMLTESRRARRRADKDETEAPETSAASRKDARRERAQQRAATADLRKSVKDHERRIEKLSADIEALERRLAEPGVYEGPTATLMDLQLRHADFKAKLAETEEAWLELSERLETAQ